MKLAVRTANWDIGRSDPLATRTAIPAFPYITTVAGITGLANRLGGASLAQAASQTGIAHVDHVSRGEGTLSTAILPPAPSLRQAPARLSRRRASSATPLHSLATLLHALVSNDALSPFRMEGELGANVHGNRLRDDPPLPTSRPLAATAIPERTVGLQGRRLTHWLRLACGVRLDAGRACICFGRFRASLRGLCRFLPALALGALRNWGC